MSFPLVVPTIHHFGPRHPHRVVAVAARSHGHLVRLDERLPIVDALHRAVRALGGGSAFVELFGVRLAHVGFVHPTTGDSVRRAVSFTAAQAHDGGEIVQASAIVGSRYGEDFVHCHAMWRDRAGAVHGGHLLPTSVVEPGSGFALVNVTDGVDLVSTDDAETFMPAFTPRPSDPTRSETEQLVPTIIARVLPNEDLTHAAIALAREAGFAKAVVRAGTGSLIGADLSSGEERRRIVDGPATEVISINGIVDAEASTAELTATLVDRHGQLHAGVLTPGVNPAAVTFELVLQAID